MAIGPSEFCVEKSQQFCQPLQSGGAQDIDFKPQLLSGLCPAQQHSIRYS